MKLKEHTLKGSELEEILAGRLGLQLKEARTVLRTLRDIILTSVTEGYRVYFSDIGIFYLYSYPERELYSPKTGDRFIAPKVYVLSIKSNKRFKEQIVKLGSDILSHEELKQRLSETTEEIEDNRFEINELRKKQNALRKDLLNYLRTRYQFGTKWSHPSLDGKSFSSAEVREALNKCKDSVPDLYSFIWSAINPETSVKNIARSRGMTEGQHRARVNKTLDSIVWNLLTKETKVKSLSSFNR